MKREKGQQGITLSKVRAREPLEGLEDGGLGLCRGERLVALPLRLRVSLGATVGDQTRTLKSNKKSRNQREEKGGDVPPRRPHPRQRKPPPRPQTPPRREPS